MRLVQARIPGRHPVGPDGVYTISTEPSDPELDESKTLKVTLPAEMHLRLHSLKILSGQTISGTVEEAVERFFEESVEQDVPLLPSEFER